MKSRLAPAIFGCVALASAAAQAAVTVERRPAGESRTVTFAGNQPDPCVLWSFFTQQTHILWVIGHPVDGCPASPVQTVTLPPLAAGRYTLVARLESGETWEKVSFPVSEAEPPDVLVDLVPAAPTPQDSVELVLSTVQRQFGNTYVFDTPPVVLGDRILVEGRFSYCPVTCPPPVAHAFRGDRYVLPPLSPGLKTLELRAGGGTVLERSFTVADPQPALGLHDGRFEVRLEWIDRQGHAHAAPAATLTRESGLFWFFDRDNVEMTVKILDGRPLNHAFWLFAASMTDLDYTLTVIDHDLAACDSQGPCPRTRIYHGAPGQNRNVIDTALFLDTPGS
jgi:hypothetical protein